MTTLRGGVVEEESKSPEIVLSDDVARKLSAWFTESDDESELSNECLVEEEKLEEIMQELYKEITVTSPSSYNSSPPPTLTSPLPSSSFPPLFAVSDVNNSESCGASMSDSSSTMMAGIEFVTPTWKYLNVGLPETGNGSPENELWVIGMGFNDNINSNNVVRGEEKEMDGCDEGEVGEDQWLARVLGWGPLELEGWV